MPWNRCGGDFVRILRKASFLLWVFVKFWRGSLSRTVVVGKNCPVGRVILRGIGARGY